MTPDFRQEALSSDTRSPSALEFFAAKTRECKAHHSQCQALARETGYLPTRVIDVGDLGDDTIRLCDRHELAPGSSYAALSHCWGGYQPTTLTTETEKSLRAGLDIQALPRTFQDAFFVCQKHELRYIWIDSL